MNKKTFRDGTLLVGLLVFGIGMTNGNTMSGVGFFIGILIVYALENIID